AAFSSASSSPDNVEDSGLDSPSHQPLDASPEPAGWAAWPSSSQPKDSASSRQPVDPFFARSPLPQEWPLSQPSPLAPPLTKGSVSSFAFPSFSNSVDPGVWSCKHIPPEDPFVAAFEHRPAHQDTWVAPPPSRTTHEDPFAPPTNGTKTLPPPNLSSRKDREKKRERSVPNPDSPDDPFAITMIGSPTHQSAIAAQTALTLAVGSSSTPPVQIKQESTAWGSVHNPFSDVGQDGGRRTVRGGGEKERRSGGEEQRRSGLPLTRLSGPQEDLCFSTDKDQDCLDIRTHTGPQRRFSGLSRGPSPISLSTQESWPVAAAFTEYINAYFKGGEHN
ncbi:F-BAR domain only protein 1 isoform X3, partial [Silurus asotus]